MKIFFVEEIDMYHSRSIVRGQGFFTEQEAEQLEETAKNRLADSAIVGYSYMVEELEVRYSHRNGESQPPRIKGYYWRVNPNPLPGILSAIVDYWDGYGWRMIEHQFDDDKIYGPILEPEITEKK